MTAHLPKSLAGAKTGLPKNVLRDIVFLIVKKQLEPRYTFESLP